MACFAATEACSGSPELTAHVRASDNAGRNRWLMIDDSGRSVRLVGKIVTSGSWPGKPT